MERVGRFVAHHHNGINLEWAHQPHTSQGYKNVAELLLQHLFGLGTDVDRPRRCAAA